MFDMVLRQTSKGVQLTEDDMENLIALYQGSRRVSAQPEASSENAPAQRDAMPAADACAESSDAPAAEAEA